MERQMTPQERASEFVTVGFASLGVPLEPYVKIVAELIEGAEADQMVRFTPLLVDLRTYVREGIQATKQCHDELPGYKSPTSIRHLANLQSMLERINEIVPDDTVIPLRTSALPQT